VSTSGVGVEMSIPEQAQDVLDYWFGTRGSAEHGSFREMWFEKREATDSEIARRFSALIERALRGEFESWAADPLSALAQILLLDQFTRNALRDTPRAFAGDPRALNAATAMVGSRQDETLPFEQRLFVYMPFEHAENLPSQDESVRLFTRLMGDTPDPHDLMKYARRHREVVQRFGRFPHRNAILSRQSTPDELAFLRQPGSGF
jgi:uncharacterized protein (DUF924 family)